MSDMKCPVCKGELYIFKSSTQDAIVCVDCGFDGNTKLWQELIRTRGALGIALDWLREVATPEKCDDDLCREFTKRKLIEIKKALEEKEAK